MKNTQRNQKPSRSAGRVSESNADSMDQELHKLFVSELADLLNAELQLTKALPKMADAAESEELEEAFRLHLAETEMHVSRLKEVFTSLDEEIENKTCKAMQGLVEEGSEIMKEFKNSSALDAGLIAAAQKVEHYEIASYGTVSAWAEQMGHTAALGLLRQTLEEEKAADEKLTEIAETLANVEAEESE